MKTSKKSLTTKSLFDRIVIHQQLIKLMELHSEFDWNELELNADISNLQESLEMHLNQLNALILLHPYWES